MPKLPSDTSLVDRTFCTINLMLSLVSQPTRYFVNTLAFKKRVSHEKEPQGIDVLVYQNFGIDVSVINR